MNSVTAIEAILPKDAPRPGASLSISTTARPRFCRSWAMAVPIMPAPTTTVVMVFPPVNGRAARKAARPGLFPVDDRLHRLRGGSFFVSGQRGERHPAVAPRRALQFTAEFQLLHEISGFQNVHRGVKR